MSAIQELTLMATAAPAPPMTGKPHQPYMNRRFKGAFEAKSASEMYIDTRGRLMAALRAM